MKILIRACDVYHVRMYNQFGPVIWGSEIFIIVLSDSMSSYIDYSYGLKVCIRINSTKKNSLPTLSGPVQGYGYEFRFSHTDALRGRVGSTSKLSKGGKGLFRYPADTEYANPKA